MHSLAFTKSASAFLALLVLAGKANAANLITDTTPVVLNYYNIFRNPSPQCGYLNNFVDSYFLGDYCLPDTQGYDSESGFQFTKLYESTGIPDGQVTTSTFLIKDYYKDGYCQTWDHATTFNGECDNYKKTTYSTSILTTKFVDAEPTAHAEPTYDIASLYYDGLHDLFNSIQFVKDAASSFLYFIEGSAVDVTYIVNGVDVGHQLYLQSYNAIDFVNICTGYDILNHFYVVTSNTSYTNGEYGWYQFSNNDCTGSSTLLTTGYIPETISTAVINPLTYEDCATTQVNGTVETISTATVSYKGYTNYEQFTFIPADKTYRFSSIEYTQQTLPTSAGNGGSPSNPTGRPSSQSNTEAGSGVTGGKTHNNGASSTAMATTMILILFSISFVLAIVF